MAFTATMISREHVMNALVGRPVDRAPVCNPNVATVDLMGMVDATFPDACRVDLSSEGEMT